MKSVFHILFFVCISILGVYAQVVDSMDIIEYDEQSVSESYPGVFKRQLIEINGEIYPVIITDTDTMIVASIDDVSLTSPRTFENPEDYRKYRKYKYYAAKVYPYAKEAIKIFRQTEYLTENMKKRKRKKYMKELQKELKLKFEDPLKNLSKTQGKILVKMIERELETPMFDLIKNNQGKFKAFYWNQSSKLYGYRLKTGYIVGENPILDAVLQDLDISYDIEEDYEFKYSN